MKEIQSMTESMVQAPNSDISEPREKLKQAVRTLAELAKQGTILS